MNDDDQIKSRPEDDQPLAEEDQNEPENGQVSSEPETTADTSDGGSVSEAKADSSEVNTTGESASDSEDDQSTGNTESDAPNNDVPGAKWYVVHTYSGHENKVAAALKQRVESEHLENKIVEVLVPTQEKIEIRGGKKETVKEKIFPGYILVKMVLDDDAWLAVRTTQGVTSFIGMSSKPTPIPEVEVRTIVNFMKQGGQPTYKQIFTDGDTVKIVDGPFAEFIGKIDSIDKERGKVKVLVSIFGRETPVELDFLQVAKL